MVKVNRINKFTIVDLVTIPALELYPNPDPSIIPAPIANTFLIAPAISTPKTSSLVYILKNELETIY